MTSSGVELQDLDRLRGAASRAEQDYLTGRLVRELSTINESELNEDDAAIPTATAQGNVLMNAAYAYSMQFLFEASEYQNVLAFFKGFEDLGMLSLINSVTMAANPDDSLLEGSFAVNLMSIDLLTVRESIFPELELVSSAGKIDPFKSE